MLFKSTREFFQLAGAESEDIDAMIASQQVLQMNSYIHSFPDATHFIIECQNEKVGRVIVDFIGKSMHLVDISFLTEARGKGYGKTVIKALQQIATENATPITLVVEQGNIAARALYLKLGFISKSVTPPHEFLVWND
ncbi:MAG: GNAT family N-acetyltransferase [Aliivibrio sp.]|uniref:GNAT family N-acetyltransferase n=1 Tax=Aliivibrio sp. TaxID=1872443 RepID=UPI001A639BF7|nr:GNAT family N-acetyltransferase [Aliivibrio sp.]